MLKEGKSEAYIELHCNAILDLICSKPESEFLPELFSHEIPETLLLDARHIQLAMDEWKTLTIASSMLLVARQAITSTLILPFVKPKLMPSSSQIQRRRLG